MFVDIYWADFFWNGTNWQDCGTTVLKRVPIYVLGSLYGLFDFLSPYWVSIYLSVSWLYSREECKFLQKYGYEKTCFYQPLICNLMSKMWNSYVQVTKYLEYIGKFSTCLRTQAGRLFGVWGALLCFSIHKSYKKLVKSTYVVRVPL